MAFRARPDENRVSGLKFGHRNRGKARQLGCYGRRRGSCAPGEEASEKGCVWNNEIPWHFWSPLQVDTQNETGLEAWFVGSIGCLEQGGKGRKEPLGSETDGRP